MSVCACGHPKSVHLLPDGNEAGSLACFVLGCGCEHFHTLPPGADDCEMAELHHRPETLGLERPDQWVAYSTLWQAIHRYAVASASGVGVLEAVGDVERSIAALLSARGKS